MPDFSSTYLKAVETELRADRLRAGMEGDKLRFETDKALFVRILHETSQAVSGLQGQIQYRGNYVDEQTAQETAVKFADMQRNLKYLDELISIKAKGYVQVRTALPSST